MYSHRDYTDNGEVAVGSRCCNTYGHERLQQHVSLGKEMFLLSVQSLLFPFLKH